MIIAFIHSGRALLPEIEAYQEYFSERGIETAVLKKHERSRLEPAVEWHFMGLNVVRKFPRAALIHEYASASVPPLAWLKDKSKAVLNLKPEFRLFLNSRVQQRFGFTDNVPCGYRDMGVPENWLTDINTDTSKQFDFVYAGSASPALEFKMMLDLFAKGNFRSKTLLVLLRDASTYQQQYDKYRNITFAGPVAHKEIRSRIISARYGINFKPNVEPYSFQTSTKILEYSACGLPVVTTATDWIRNFEKESGACFFYLREDMHHLNPDEVANYPFRIADVRRHTWQQQIESSGIMLFLKQRLGLQ